jgi:hypothetical protein
MAETVVVESWVLSLISIRAMEPARRIVSSTLKRFIARISSGSAVFMRMVPNDVSARLRPGIFDGMRIK